MPRTTRRFAVAAMMLSLIVIAAGKATRADLVIDGGFEPPNPTATPGLFQSGYVTYLVGSSFGGPSNNAWTVVQQGGGSADVTVTSTTEFTNHPFSKTYYNGNSGLQYLDLTGTTDNGVKIGVQQTLVTTNGGQYQLSFYVGNFNSVTAPIEADINGASVGTFTNAMTATFPSYNGDGVAGDSWQRFTYNFAATGSSTTIAFYSMAASGVELNGLDDVSVVQAVPEPSMAALLLTGASSFLVVRLCYCRRRSPHVPVSQ